MIDELKRAVGADNLGKLWLLAYETFGPEFTLEDALSLSSIAKRTDHPKTCLNVSPDHIFENESGGFSLIPRKPLEIS